ncbi:MAG TPA: glycosyltransferase [Gemmatimonadales bacterium]|nr:glycosyltransferase [Gemmatimonadales bacterium]
MTIAAEPLSVLFIVRSLGFGGAERQLAALASGLHRRGHRITVVSYYGGGAMARELALAGVAVATLGKRGRWDLVGPCRRLRAAVQAEQPAVLHGYLPDGNLLSMLARRWTRRSVVVWGVRASAFETAPYDWLAVGLFRLSCRLARRADLIIANSQAGAAHHVALGYPSDRVTVVANGIDTVRFRPDPEARARQRERWGIGPGERLIGLVGRLDPMKDHPTFLSAAALLAEERPEVRFVCVGEGPPVYRAELEARGRALGARLRWAAPQEDVVAVYNALDLLTLPSAFGEGFPNVVGEAMACGVRCVVTDVGDAARVVGPSGLVVPPRDPAALAAAWRTVLTAGSDGSWPDPRQRIVEEFNLERMITSTEAVLREVVRRTGRREGG